MALARCINNHLYSLRRYGKICPYCPQPENTEDENGQPVEKPVSGWLVCIKGPNKGRDYRIVAGNNLIGRDQDMQIRILGDTQIINRRHAVILFETKRQTTKLLPVENSKLIYCNGNMVYKPLELQNYDTIELGKSTFKFISLCGENFSWDRLKTVRDLESDMASSDNDAGQEETDNNISEDKISQEEKISQNEEIIQQEDISQEEENNEPLERIALGAKL